MIKLSLIEGVWVNPTYPTVIIHHKYCDHYVIFLVNIDEESKQAITSAFDIEQDEKGYFFGSLNNQQRIEFEKEGWLLVLSKFGSYIQS